jgi:hypothetical protein
VIFIAAICRHDEAILGWDHVPTLHASQMDGGDGDLPWWGDYGGLWRVIGRPQVGPAKSQEERIENAETGNGRVLDHVPWRLKWQLSATRRRRPEDDRSSAFSTGPQVDRLPNQRPQTCLIPPRHRSPPYLVTIQDVEDSECRVLFSSVYQLVT